MEQWRTAFFDDIDWFRAIEPLFDPLDDLVFSVKDLKGRYVAVSSACVARCRLSHRNQAIGKTAHDLFAPHLAARYSAQDDYVFRTGKSLVDSLDKTPFSDLFEGWCLTYKVPLRNRKREIVGLACISRDVTQASRHGLIDDAFANSIDYIRTNYQGHLRIEAIAELAGLSPAQFERRMKRVFALSPGQFILKTRIDAAASLLQATSDPIAEIAAAVGFCDPSSLSRHFRQVTGLSPRQYRQVWGLRAHREPTQP